LFCLILDCFLHLMLFLAAETFLKGDDDTVFIFHLNRKIELIESINGFIPGAVYITLTKSIAVLKAIDLIHGEYP
jgi:hypothetical protein